MKEIFNSKRLAFSRVQNFGANSFEGSLEFSAINQLEFPGPNSIFLSRFAKPSKILQMVTFFVLSDYKLLNKFKAQQGNK